MTFDPYAAGYRACACSCGFAFMPWFLSDRDAGEWLAGFMEAHADALGKRKPELAPEVKAAIASKKGVGA